MAYIPNTWIARQGTDLNKFVDQNGNYYVFTPAPGNVVSEGTPFSADWMNHIEQGIAGAQPDVLDITHGGTGATTAAGARANLEVLKTVVVSGTPGSEANTLYFVY